ncbi:MAG: ferrous iron transport protein A [Ignavibacteriales bacterium]|nr:ferrous iron transport protein A [Ignavibacteriales bacterium]
MKKLPLTFPLIKANRGQRIRIHALSKGAMRAQFIRLGIHEGERLTCFERLPGGTIVLQKHRQQIAVGARLAREILVAEIAGSEE